MARLIPGFGRSFAHGPGHLGRAGVAGAMLWDASFAIRDQDLLAGFWDYDARQTEWLSGFLCDAAMTAWFDALANPPEPEEEPEEMFARGSMNTLGSDVVDDV